jgi:hypothetical protein
MALFTLQHSRGSVARAALGIACLLSLAACSSSGSSSPSSSSLTGLFKLTPGACGGFGASGSYFRMVDPNGSLTRGPFVTNVDSTCADKTWTTLSPGTQGGLFTGQYQPQPQPPFGTGGNSASAAIIQPQSFFAVDFGLSTNQTDPQTKTAVPAPRITNDGGRLTGNLSSFAVSWNGQFFNQGSPKPGGATPAGTTPVHGTYDQSTHAYTLTWSSRIEGGPFNNFVGTWHLQGTFQPS